MSQCGLELEEVIASFPKLNKVEIEEIYKVVKETTGEIVKAPVLKKYCS